VAGHDFSLLYRAQTRSEAYPASYPMDIRVISPEGKADEHHVDDSHPSSVIIQEW
jgi:hypothetical protein